MYKNERWKCLFQEKIFDRVIWHTFKQKKNDEWNRKYNNNGENAGGWKQLFSN